MNIKLTNGKKIITKDKKYYESNLGFYKKNGFVPLNEVKKEIKKATVKDISDNVVKLKTKKKKNEEKEMKQLNKYWKLAKENKKVTMGAIIVIAVLLTWIF